MSWSKWRGGGLDRRAFLGGAAAAITLPWLPSLIPHTARAAQGQAPVRLVWWYLPNGIHMPEFKPPTAGADYFMPRILQPLAGMRDELLVLSGLSNMAGSDDRPGDHARGTAAFLTCQRPTYEGVNLGISADQVAANARGSETPYTSLQLGTEGGDPVGTCDSGYSCAYVRNISWAGPSSPLPKQTSPRTVFDRLFAGFDAGLTEADRARRAVYRSSVLDKVAAEARSLQGRLAVEDKLRLDEYLTGVRQLEERLGAGEATCAPIPRPAARLDAEQQIDALTDLTVLALRCGLTRLVTFMLGNAGSNRSYGFIGAPGAHHEISHHQSLPLNIQKLTTIGAWEMERFAVLLAKMAAAEEGEGTLLDNSLVMLGSEISDGDRHNHDDLPVLLAGRGGGAVTPGRHVVYDNVPLANLHIGMLEAFGVSVESFGIDGTQPLAELRV